MTNLKRFLVSVASAALLAACSDPAGTPPAASTAPAADAAAATGAEQAVLSAESVRINAWFEEVFQRDVARSPMTQTFLGQKTNYDQWNDASPEFDQEDFELGQADLA